MNSEELNDDPPGQPRQPQAKGRFRLLIIALVIMGILFVLPFLVRQVSLMIFPDVPGVTLTDISSIEQLRTRFNEDKGKPRLMLFVSPT